MNRILRPYGMCSIIGTAGFLAAPGERVPMPGVGAPRHGFPPEAAHSTPPLPVTEEAKGCENATVVLSFRNARPTV